MNYCSASANEIVLSLYVEAYHSPSLELTCCILLSGAGVLRCCFCVCFTFHRSLIGTVL